MRKLTVTTIAILCYGMNALCQNVPVYVPTNGLVGWWPFSGNAYDSSGNGNNGTNIGASLTTNRFGQANKAYSFNGIGNEIVVQDNSNLSFTSNNFSYSFWINSNASSSSIMAILSKRKVINSSMDWEMYLLKTGSDCDKVLGVPPNSIGMYNWDLPGNLCSYTGQPNGVFPITQSSTWEHYVITANGSIKSIFKNGALHYTIPAVSNPCLMGNGAGNLTIGSGGWWGVTHYMNGKLDDIGIWNRALTQLEIIKLYNASVSVGIETNTVSESIKVYPNPARSQLYISSSQAQLNTEYKIYNSIGMLVLTGNLKGTTTELDINKLQDGFYIIEINGNSKKSFIVSR